MTTGRACVVLFAAAGAAACAGQARSAFDGARAFEHLRQLVLIGPRPAGSDRLAHARRYITDELRKLDLSVTEQVFEARTPLGPVRMVNLIARIPGAQPERLAVAGHYETKFFRDVLFAGANDGGSSAAFLLELARVLSQRQHTLTIELIFFDGEEAMVEWIGTDHTYGSRHYVEAAQQAGTLQNLKALVLVDMIGDRDLRLRREGNSTAWLTDLIWGAARRLDLQRYFSDETFFIEDDHIPFLEAGLPAVDLIDLDYPWWHTPGDTVDKTSSRSLQVVGDVLLEALPEIEARLTGR